MSKYQEGDIVVINERPTDCTKDYFDADMERYVGSIGEIIWAGYNRNYNQAEYHIEGCEGWYWLESWLEPMNDMEASEDDINELMGVIGVSLC